MTAVAVAGHALPDPQRMETFPKGLRGVLHAPDAVEDETFGGLFPVICHVQRSEGEVVSMRSENA